MSLKFTYYFGGQEYEYNGGLDTMFEDEFEYEADWEEAKDYILRTHSLEDIIKDYIDTGMYDKLNSESKEALNTYDGFDGTYDSINNMSEDTKFELVGEIIIDLLDDTDIYEDELKDYFEQDAFDSFEDSIS